MMKKFLSLLMACLTLFSATVFADDTIQARPISLPISQDSIGTVTGQMSTDEVSIITDDPQQYTISIDDATLSLDTRPTVINGITYVPLKPIADALGYRVIWDSSTQSVQLAKGAQYTSVIIGENRYIINRMAPFQLSAAPTLLNGRTLVPVEFITDVLGFGLLREGNQFNITRETYETLSGYIFSIDSADDTTRIAIANTLDENTSLFDTTVLVVTNTTILQISDFKEGDFIRGVHLPIMTMSLPSQTPAVIIY